MFWQKKVKKDKRLKDSIFSFRRFVLYFAISGFAVTVSFLLFFSGSLFNTTRNPVIIPEGTVEERALRTLFNIMFICLFLSIFDGIRKRIYTYRPVMRISEALRKITSGDFSVRIKPIHKRRAFNEYDIIIEDINTMAKELSSIETLKTDFISSASHEIKTPLAIIQSYAEILQSDELTREEINEYAKNLKNASQRLNGLITSILKLNKLENQQIFPETKKYDLGEQLVQSILLYENKLEEKKLKIATDIEENVYIEADEELLLIVWSNLISNAVKFSSEKGRISVSLKKTGNFAKVCISDTGCGMTKETGMRIFEKFYQGDSSHTTEGNGLGLALVKRVIDITKSEITVESELDKGSSFTVKIPLHQ